MHYHSIIVLKGECSELVLPPNARLSTQLRTTGSQVEMTCVEGYEMSTGFPVLRRCVHRTSSDGSVGRDGPMWEDIAGDWDSFRCVCKYRVSHALWSLTPSTDCRNLKIIFYRKEPGVRIVYPGMGSYQ